MADGGAPLNKRAGRGRDREIDVSSRCPQSTPPDVQGFLAPKSLGEVKELARMIALAEWAPECYRDLDGNYLQPKIELAILHGATVGLGPIAAVHAIALINGTPSIWGDGALSVIEHSGLLEDMTENYEEDGEEGLTAICTMKRRDRATPIVTRFSLAMAERAGLTRVEGPWQTYPERMLRMRARSWTMRDGFADVLRGLQLREEVEDYAGRGGARPRRTPPGESNLQGGLRPHALPRPRLTAAPPVLTAPTTRVSAVLPSLAADKTDEAHGDRPEAEVAVGNATVNGSDAGDEPTSVPDPSLLLKIDPTWGIEKVFHHYRAALTALCDQPRDHDEITAFRRANIGLERRLREKLPARAKSLEVIYRKSGQGGRSGASRARP